MICRPLLLEDVTKMRKNFGAQPPAIRFFVEGNSFINGAMLDYNTHRIHVCYIYGNIYHQYTLVMLAYIAYI